MPAFHLDALAKNERFRAGRLRRVVYLLSNNPRKMDEFRAVLGRYGIEVLASPRREDPDYVRALLTARAPDTRVIAVLRETSNLFRADGAEVSTLETHAEPVENRARLDVYTMVGDNLHVRHYQHRIAGFVDLTRAVDPTTFGWDDRFVIDDLGLSYGDLARRGFKVSSRDMVLGQFLKDDVHYRARVDMRFHPLSPDGVIDFGKSVADFVTKTPLLGLPALREFGLTGVFEAVANDGAFFRAPINRREKVYWLPGLNAGVPLTPKKDSVHEITFLVHDLGHALIPDLIYTGEDVPNGRAVYVAHRMMSEAMSLVLADMLYVAALDRAGVAYEFSKRKIYPLFRALKVDFADPALRVAALKKVMFASARFCLRGDDGPFRALIGDDADGLRALDEFARKYTPFFVEDYRWTERNFSNMQSRRDEIARWAKSALPLAARLGVPVDTVATAAERLANREGDLVDLVFEDVFERRIQPIFTGEVTAESTGARRRRAFARYMLGQIGVFARYGFAPGSLAHQARLLDRLGAPDAGATPDSVAAIRALYDEYVESLRARNLISNDDASTYREVFPLFEPFFVYYDGSLDSYEDLGAISGRILSREASIPKPPLGAMRSLIEEGGGEIINDRFVTRPGVVVLAANHAPPDLASATVLFGGLSADAALEFVAHAREADVARLTSNATRAMDDAFFAVPDADRAMHLTYTREVLATHQSYDERFRPRDRGPAGREYFNRARPGSKATALAITMRLTDFDRLLRGRLAPVGNEHEVVELATRLAEALRALFPREIATVDEYRAAGNGSKYANPSPAVVAISTEPTTTPFVSVLSDTTLTERGRALFDMLRIDDHLDDGERLAEFRARLTYLTFPKSRADGAAYLRRMTRELGHRSVLAGTRVAFEARHLGAPTRDRLARVLSAHNGRVIDHGVVTRFEADLKELHRIVEELRLNGESWLSDELTGALRARYPNAFSG